MKKNFLLLERRRLICWERGNFRGNEQAKLFLKRLGSKGFKAGGPFKASWAQNCPLFDNFFRGAEKFKKFWEIELAHAGEEAEPQ
ncbi:MAG: hypothetical protein CM15mP58_21540 [Burkholderiaceae bacterium]|nr:MAG: hypothetical protein CM15mP58_21540 [Burkholderiaceae bacterium]